MHKNTHPLTWVHLTYLLYEGLIKTCDYGATYWNHEVLVQALHKGIYSSNTGPLMKDSQGQILLTTMSIISEEK